MARESFDVQLRRLQDELLAMGELVDQQVANAVLALSQRDAALANVVIAADEQINHKQRDVEEKCLVLIATHQPLASDLRAIFSIASIANDLERMSDHAKGIAKISLRMADQPLLKPLIDIPRMAEKDRYMLREQLAAFVARDSHRAKQLAAEDEEINRLYDQIYRELLTFMMEDPRTIGRATFLLWIAHNLERVGDRTTNIAERTVFLITSEIEELNAETGREG
jgi:phosphate transport system protein